MERYLELNSDGLVINIIVWDGESPYNPEGHTLMLCDDYPSASFGWIFDGDNWIAPPEPEVEPES
jgi:hypothetical protein